MLAYVNCLFMTNVEIFFAADRPCFLNYDPVFIMV